MAIRYKRLTTRAELETVFLSPDLFSKIFSGSLSGWGGAIDPIAISPWICHCRLAHGCPVGLGARATDASSPDPAIGAVANITTLRVICQHFAAAPQPPPAIYTTQQQTMRRRPGAAHPGRFLALSLSLSLYHHHHHHHFIYPIIQQYAHLHRY